MQTDPISHSHLHSVKAGKSLGLENRNRLYPLSIGKIQVSLTPTFCRQTQMNNLKYTRNSWPMQEAVRHPREDGWKICSCPWTSKKWAEFQAVHLSALQKSSAAGQLSTAEKNRATVSADQGWLSALFCCSQCYKAPGPFVQNTLPARSFAVASGRQEDILPRPTELRAKGKYAEGCVWAQGLLVYSGLLSITGCFWKPVELN